MRAHLTSRRRLLGAAAAGSVLAPAAVATSAQAAKPSRVDFDTTAIDRAIQDMVDTAALGVVATVVDPSGTYSTAAGLRDLQRGAARPQDRARIASVTKGMIATMVMQQIEAGVWSLDTTIDDVVPGLYPGHGEVTVSQLMNHTSGMPDAIWSVFEDRSFWDITPDLLLPVTSAYYDERELVTISQQMDWLFEPGTATSYSNTGYVVLSIMLEEATGTKVERLLRERIFLPAGMRQARMEESALVRGRHLTPYARFGDELVALPEVNPSIFSGAGGVYATSEDVTDFMHALMTGALLGQEYVEMMVTPVGAAAQWDYGYGLYLITSPCVDADGQPEVLIGHDGAGFGTETISFSTRDGSRRMAMAWTGRTYDQQGPFADPNAVLKAAFSATCPAEMTSGAGMGAASIMGSGFHL